MGREERPRKLYTCKRCGKQNNSTFTYETGWPEDIEYWCLEHRPLSFWEKVRRWFDLSVPRMRKWNN